jgi:hypothetical protein
MFGRQFQDPEGPLERQQELSRPRGALVRAE